MFGFGLGVVHPIKDYIVLMRIMSELFSRCVHAFSFCFQDRGKKITALFSVSRWQSLSGSPDFIQIQIMTYFPNIS